MSQSAQHRLTFALVLTTLLVRAAIPAGYMPASLDSGLLFKLCPSGVPAELMAAITGAGHHHETNTNGDHFDAEQCPIGQLLSAAIAVDSAWQANDVPILSALYVGPVQVLESRTPANRRSRDPPV